MPGGATPLPIDKGMRVHQLFGEKPPQLTHRILSMNASLLLKRFPKFLTLLFLPACVLAESIELSSAGVPLTLLNRDIAEFRVSSGNFNPQQRAVAAQQVIEEIVATALTTPEVTVEEVESGARILANGREVMIIKEGDVYAIRGDTLESTVQKAVQNLNLVFEEYQELTTGMLVKSALMAALATVVLLVLIWIMWHNRRWVEVRLLKFSSRQASQIKSKTLRLVGLQNSAAILKGMTTFVFWSVVLVAGYIWLEYILLLFPHTRPFGEHLGRRFLEQMESAGSSILHALPNLGIVFIFWLLARFASSVNRRFFRTIARRQDKGGFFDATTALVTQRLMTILIWVVAIIVAFPYIPGSHSPAFRGISVLAGLMISLGSGNLISQMLNGLIVIYNGLCRVGDHIRIDNHEGTLTAIGLTTSKMRTLTKEEVYIPNAHLTSRAVINFTQIPEEEGLVYPVKLSIGYNAPWRKVHALLKEAALKTEGVRKDPPPTVFQRELADFYVVYQLNVVLETPRGRRLTISHLNQNLQDAFNEAGIQIMSPHYRSDPDQPVIVPKDEWGTTTEGSDESRK